MYHTCVYIVSSHLFRCGVAIWGHVFRQANAGCPGIVGALDFLRPALLPGLLRIPPKAKISLCLELPTSTSQFDRIFCERTEVLPAISPRDETYKKGSSRVLPSMPPSLRKKISTYGTCGQHTTSQCCPAASRTITTTA